MVVQSCITPLRKIKQVQDQLNVETTSIEINDTIFFFILVMLHVSI